MARSRSRFRWIVPLCAAAAVAGGLVAAPLLINTTRNSSATVSPRELYLFARQEPRLSQAPLDALTTFLDLTEDQRARVEAIQQVVRKHDQQFDREQMTRIQNVYGGVISRNPTPPPANNLLAVGIERLKRTWRQRQIRADSEEIDRKARENHVAVLALESTAAADMNRVLTDGQRQKLPQIIQQMRELRSVGLPIRFCAAVLENPRQRQQIAAIAAETDGKRKRSAETYNAAMQAASAVNSSSGGSRASWQGRSPIRMQIYGENMKIARAARSRALATLTPAQRQIMKRSGSVASPF